MFFSFHVLSIRSNKLCSPLNRLSYVTFSSHRVLFYWLLDNLTNNIYFLSLRQPPPDNMGPLLILLGML